MRRRSWYPSPSTSATMPASSPRASSFASRRCSQRRPLPAPRRASCAAPATCCASPTWRSTMAVRTIDVRERVMSRNDELATQVRARLAEHGVVAINLVSSPGAGKTALLERTLADLGEALDIAVITGDVQTQNDADRLARHTTRMVSAVVTGGACHLDA